MSGGEPENPGQDSKRQKRSSQGLIEIIGATGAIFVVLIGMAFVFIVTLVALGTLPGGQKAAVVTAAFTVFGTIVGAYFGVKVGAAGREEAEAARHAAGVKVEELAAHAAPEVVEQALDKAQERLEAEDARTGTQPRTVL